MSAALSNEQLWNKFKSDYIHNNGLTKKRTNKLTSLFNLVSRAISKPLDSVKKEDLELFVNRVNEGKITKENGKPYSGSTKSDIKKFLKLLYKWRRGDGTGYPPEVAWLKTRIAKDERPEQEPIISENEALKLASSFSQPEYRAFVLLAFDSGFRIDELMSCTKKDLSWEEFEPNKKCWWLSCNRSKTFTRKVDVQLFTDEITNFANSSYYKSLGVNDLIWSVSYQALVKNLKKHSEAVLGRKDMHPHLLRHSSATLYAEIYNGNVINLSQRFGWSYTAQEMQVYIRKSKGLKRLAANASYQNEVIKLKRELEDLKERFARVESLLGNDRVRQALKLYKEKKKQKG